jgi:hypothetical protein
MKVVCVNDQVEIGLPFFKRTTKRLGLTKDKTYNAMLFSNASGQFTTTDAEFLIYDDTNQWVTYDVCLFKPCE